jgi:hypothetical protein
MQLQLDAEMEVRRKRVEEWRKKRAAEAAAAELERKLEEEAAAAAAAAGSNKGWSLEDDEDDEEPAAQQGEVSFAGVHSRPVIAAVPELCCVSSGTVLFSYYCCWRGVLLAFSTP